MQLVRYKTSYDCTKNEIQRRRKYRSIMNEFFFTKEQIRDLFTLPFLFISITKVDKGKFVLQEWKNMILIVPTQCFPNFSMSQTIKYITFFLADHKNMLWPILDKICSTKCYFYSHFTRFRLNCFTTDQLNNFGEQQIVRGPIFWKYCFTQRYSALKFTKLLAMIKFCFTYNFSCLKYKLR